MFEATPYISSSVSTRWSEGCDHLLSTTEDSEVSYGICHGATHDVPSDKIHAVQELLMDLTESLTILKMSRRLSPTDLLRKLRPQHRVLLSAHQHKIQN